jgi:hypothetical protein
MPLDIHRTRSDEPEVSGVGAARPGLFFGSILFSYYDPDAEYHLGGGTLFCYRLCSD